MNNARLFVFLPALVRSYNGLASAFSLLLYLLYGIAAFIALYSLVRLSMRIPGQLSRLAKHIEYRHVP